ncbi:MAG: electron transfer flavoprotein subunit beta/FixA family protein [Desulfobulbaceae bacterium]|nr:electron transfer flavoprotein subunit beta/FixA family protein [Desulfobulbaceae bacterium]HIJ79631.1 electron transfer flavoprotein subunit beta/FixA family protein [Deltaproteobacteria bacterium]
MKIIVCVKQVPDAKDVRLDPKTNTLAREGVQSIMNPYDRHALEEAVRIKEQFGGTVTVLSMGPPQAEATLRDAVACGADDAVLVSDRAFAGSDTWATTYTLSQAIKNIGGADLILCGKQAIDGDTAQVGPGLAERMGIPFVAYVRKVNDCAGGSIKAERLMDDGYDAVEVALPALFTVVKEINEPRVPSLKGKMRAKKLEINTLNAVDIEADLDQLGLKGSPTQVVRVFSPELRGERSMLNGSADEQVAQLFDKLEPLL